MFKCKYDLKANLSDILKALNTAANECNETALESFDNLIGQYFTKDEATNTFSPIIKELELKEDSHIFLPLIALHEPKALYLDRLEFEFDVTASAIEPPTDENLSQVIVDMKSNGKNMHVKAKFKSLDVSEAMARIIDKYTNLIDPMIISTEENENGGTDS